LTKPEILLSEEQQAVIGAADYRLVVTAAAGAGKTRVLVERYLRHVIEEHVAPERILTITSRAKAAAEMKKRIVASFARTRSAYRSAGSGNRTDPDDPLVLREASSRKFAGSRLDPQFEILSEAQARRLTVESVREALASPLDESPAAEALVFFPCRPTQVRRRAIVPMRDLRLR